MGGGLMQLVAYGAQDIYLTGNPQITFFKVVYRRHTNFSMECIKQSFDGTADYGNRVTSTITRNGDLVSGLYIEHEQTTANVGYCNNFGHALLRTMEVEIGGQSIDKQDARWLSLYSDLTESNPYGMCGDFASPDFGTGSDGMKYSLTNGSLLIDISASKTDRTFATSASLSASDVFQVPFFNSNSVFIKPGKYMGGTRYQKMSGTGIGKLNNNKTTTASDAVSASLIGTAFFNSTSGDIDTINGTFGETKETTLAGGSASMSAACDNAGVALDNKHYLSFNNTLKKILIPLRFWFCKNPGLALPLIALQYHEVKIIIQFETEAKLIVGNAATPTINLWADYIYLDTDERRRFAQISHEYLIEQVQIQTGTSSDKTQKLVFNHPVKELVWCYSKESTNTLVQSASYSAIQSTLATPVGNNINAEYKLQLNGQDRFETRSQEYFTRQQIWQHHTGWGSPIADDGIFVYSFALKPEEHQPSGTCNFSRIDSAILETVMQPSNKFSITEFQPGGTSGYDTIHIYAVNYNVLRIMSGMGGLAYSN